MKDVSGNALGGLSAQVATTSDAVALVNISNVAAKSLTSISFDVDKQLSSIDVTKFTIDGTALSVTGATYVNAAGKSTVTLTVDNAVKDIKSDLSGVAVSLVNLAGSALTTTFGTVNGAFIIAVAPAQDKIAPTVVSTVTATTGTIAITYSEALNVGSVSIYSYTVAGNTVTGVAVGGAGKVVTLTLGTAIATSDTPAVTQVLNIQDVNGNVLAPSAAVTSTDGIAATYTATATANLTSATITASEALAIGGVAVANGANIGGQFTLSGAGTITSATYNSTTHVITFVIGAGAANGDTISAKATLTDIAGNPSATSVIDTAASLHF